MAFIVNETFTTGSRPGDWEAGNGANFGYATSPAPLEGTYSLRLDVGTVGIEAFNHGSEVSGEQWGHFLLNIDARPDSYQKLYELTNNSAVTILELYIFSDGSIRADDGSGATSQVGALVAGTTYHVWWRYKPGSGSNAELELWANTSDDRAGASIHTSMTNGIRTSGMRRLTFVSGAGGGPKSFTVDTVQWSDTDAFTGGGGGGGSLPVGMSSGFMD